MKKYAFAALVSIGLLASTAALYANPGIPAAVAATDAGLSDTAPENAKPDPSEALADPAVPGDENVAPVEIPGTGLPELPSQADDPLGTAATIVDDVRTGDWRHAIAGVLVLLMLGLTKIRKRVKWFSGDRGGSALVLILGVGGGVVTALYASGPLDWRLFAGSISASFTAAGMYTVVKKLIWPSDKADA